MGQRASFKILLLATLRFASVATQNRTRDHLIAADFYSQMLYQLSYSRLGIHELLQAAMDRSIQGKGIQLSRMR